MTAVSEIQVSCPMCDGEGFYQDSYYPYASNSCPMCYEFGECAKSEADEYIAQKKEAERSARQNRQRYKRRYR